MDEINELNLPGTTVPVAVIGGGPAGLAAAEVLTTAGYAVHLFDAMPSVGRKFLLAGKGGLNLTHSEDADAFASRYGSRRSELEPLLADFGPKAMREWAAGLGVDTFVGSSGRVFPVGMKAAPLLRAWLHRLRHPASGQPVKLHMRHRWLGWDEVGLLRFDSPSGPLHLHARATVLALGGGSWARLGSDGAWVPWLRAVGVPVTPLQPSNCGFDVVGRAVGGLGVGGWSDHFRSHYAGHPFKSVRLRCVDAHGHPFERKGEFVATESGVEGSLIYAASAWLREQILASGHATFELDLLPDFSAERVLAEVSTPRGSRSLSTHLKSRLGLDGIKLALLYELLPKEAMNQPQALARAIKGIPIHLRAPRPLDEAISSAGGVPFEALDADLMLRQRPSVFCSGEMLDWEAPTGGYLLTACWATGRQAGMGALRWLQALEQGDKE